MDILTEVVLTEDLQKFQTIYQEQLYANNVTPKAQFEYAWCLVRNKHPADIKKGIVLLQELCKTHEEGQRDYLYYLAVGNARIKKYSEALDYIRLLLSTELGNQQAMSLETVIRKKMDRERLIGMTIKSGAVLAIAAVVGLVFAARKSLGGSSK